MLQINVSATNPSLKLLSLKQADVAVKKRSKIKHNPYCTIKQTTPTTSDFRTFAFFSMKKINPTYDFEQKAEEL